VLCDPRLAATKSEMERAAAAQNIGAIQKIHKYAYWAPSQWSHLIIPTVSSPDIRAFDHGKI
jgi:hypothetical protein